MMIDVLKEGVDFPHEDGYKHFDLFILHNTVVLAFAT